jgi:ATPase subunit of ABC transporter with duplicated ATPase domains
VRVQLAGVAKHFGAQTVLDHVTLALGPRSRVGVVGPNGVGKSTLLRILAGVEQPDVGNVVREPGTLTAGYLAQERPMNDHETLFEALARQSGVAVAERELLDAARGLAVSVGTAANERYSAALDAFLSLGGADFEARARTTCAELGLKVDLHTASGALSGGEAARAALAAILLDSICSSSTSRRTTRPRRPGTPREVHRLVRGRARPCLT